ncbi:MAG: hypothetical protein ACLGIK_08150 [Gemmatimonadota bacterium]
MRHARLALRFLAALVAVVQGFAPGAASIVDARPAAVAMSERAFPHFEEPGSPHAIAHEEHCVLCNVASSLSAEPAAPETLGEEGRGDWPPRATWRAIHAAHGVAARRSRAPPA